MNRGGRDGKVNFGQADIETPWDIQVYGHLVGSSVCGSGAQERSKAGERDLSVTSGHKLATHGPALATGGSWDWLTPFFNGSYILKSVEFI